MRHFGSAGRIFALQIAIQQIEQIQQTQASGVATQGQPPQQTKALEQFLADELAELQRREPIKWSGKRQSGKGAKREERIVCE